MKEMEQHTPLFSVIVASYNYEDYIRYTLDSLANQTLRDFEVIIVDDGSGDRSWRIIQGYLEKNDNFKALTHPQHQNKGLAATLQLGISKARGKYIAFLESDDFWSVNHLAEKAAYLKEQSSEPAILVNRVTVYNTDQEVSKYAEYCAQTLKENQGKNVFKFMKSGNLLPTFSAVSVKKELLETCDFNSPLAPWLDYWLWMQLTFSHQVDYIDEPLTYWRQHQNSYNRNSNITVKERERFIGYACDFLWKNSVCGSFDQALKPAFSKNNIAVALAADNNYAPYLGVTISSIIKHSSPENNYDLIILESRISEYYKTLLKSLADGHANVSIRFADIANLAGLKEHLFQVCLHFTIETYYRFFIINLCENYDKVIYLDCDTVVRDDIAKLYKTDLGNHLVAAARDYEMIRIMNSEDRQSKGSFYQYARDVLNLKKPFDYMQSGVAVMNIRQLIRENIQEALFFKLFEVGVPRLVDQDIFNSICQGRILYFSPVWNFEWQLNWKDDLKENLSERDYREVMSVCENPKIIHYCDCKPWKFPHLKLAFIWWQYARETPFYEEVIFRHTVQPAAANQPQRLDFPVLRDLVNYSKNRWKYWRYILFSKLTFGKKRKKYKLKRKEMRLRLKQTHALIKGKEWLLNA